MPAALKLLLVEDSEPDAELLAMNLRRTGYAELDYQRVSSAETLRAALEGREWDIVVSDFSMPGFSGLDALEIVREHDEDLPFILVSGSVGEEIAVAAMKAGAQDYIMKPGLARLAPAVRREMAEKMTRLESKKLTVQLARSQKLEAIGHLAGGVAHEFNNILMGIGGYAQLMSSEPDVSEESQKDLARIDHLCKRGAGLTKQLLTFSRADEGERIPLDVVPLIKSTAKMLRRVIPENISIEVTAAPGAGSASVDPGQLEQVLVNLAINARDAMPDGGKLLFHVAGTRVSDSDVPAAGRVAPGRYVEIAVTDTGCGMDRETVEHVFEPFFTTKDVGEGTGLGLSAVFGIVSQHGGAVTVYSEPGQGTTFRVYLPREEDASEDEAEAAGPAALHPGTGRILVAEDDEAVRHVLVTFLRKHGYEVLAAADPEEAEALAIRDGKPLDLLLTDVTMPVCSGPELFQRLNDAFPEMKALFVSGYFEASIPKVRDLPDRCQFMQKPFSLHELGGKIAALLSGSTQLQARGE